MILAAVDIGNTRAHIGFFRGRRLLEKREVPSRALPSLRSWLKRAELLAVSSVSSSSAGRLRHPRICRLGIDFPPAIRVDVRRPREIGMDRLANATAAHERARGPCVVVDLGTAITFDVVDVRGAFIGGLIAPGMGLGARALAENTSLLPKVSLQVQKKMIQDRTADAIRSGLYWSVAGLIEIGKRKLRKELGKRLVVFGTGGDAPMFRSLFDRVVPHLTLEGIRISYVHHFGSNDCSRALGDRRS